MEVTYTILKSGLHHTAIMIEKELVVLVTSMNRMRRSCCVPDSCVQMLIVPVCRYTKCNTEV